MKLSMELFVFLSFPTHQASRFACYRLEFVLLAAPDAILDCHSFGSVLEVLTVDSSLGVSVSVENCFSLLGIDWFVPSC